MFSLAKTCHRFITSWTLQGVSKPIVRQIKSLYPCCQQVTHQINPASQRAMNCCAPREIRTGINWSGGKRALAESYAEWIVKTEQRPVQEQGGQYKRSQEFRKGRFLSLSFGVVKSHTDEKQASSSHNIPNRPKRGFTQAAN